MISSYITLESEDVFQTRRFG